MVDYVWGKREIGKILIEYILFVFHVEKDIEASEFWEENSNTPG